MSRDLCRSRDRVFRAFSYDVISGICRAEFQFSVLAGFFGVLGVLGELVVNNSTEPSSFPHRWRTRPQHHHQKFPTGFCRRQTLADPFSLFSNLILRQRPLSRSSNPTVLPLPVGLWHCYFGARLDLNPKKVHPTRKPQNFINRAHSDVPNSSPRAVFTVERPLL